MSLFLFVFFIFLYGCDVSSNPNIITYTSEEVLQIAKDKYDIQEWYFTGIQVRDEIPFNITNGENVEETIKAFAGVNGNREYKMQFLNHKFYVAYGVNSQNEHKFIYYNLHLNKNMEIAKAMGISNYPYACYLKDLATGIDSIKSNYIQSKVAYLKDLELNDLNVVLLDQLTISVNFTEVGYYTGLKLVKENDEIVVDIVNLVDMNYDLFYSSRSAYQYEIAEITLENYDTFFTPILRIDSEGNDYYGYFQLEEKGNIDFLDLTIQVKVTFNYNENKNRKTYNHEWVMNKIRVGYINKILIARNANDFSYEDFKYTIVSLKGFIRYQK